VRPKPWTLAAAVALVAAAAGGVVAITGGKAPTSAAQESPTNTATVETGRLSAMVSLDGTLTHRAGVDGSPYVAINRARGTYTTLPEIADRVDCGGVLYRVDENPVLLLCGTVPAYRDLRRGDVGQDVRQLNRNLHKLGYDADAGVNIDPGDDVFTVNTEQALEVLQHDKGCVVTGALDIDDAVFLPEPVRVAQVTGELGEPARPGGHVAQATSDTLEVQVSLDPSQRGEVKERDRALITLPDNTSATGTVDRIGRAALVPAGQNSNAGDAIIPVYIRLDHPARVRGLDQAPVRVDVTTEGVQRALSVPVTALVGRSGGGVAVEVVRAGGRRELVGVKVGLFDTTAGRVQVDGDVHPGDAVVVPTT
jgi:peptidoglycan hydrolase-like protein with peptidoglycan-binding domain